MKNRKKWMSLVLASVVGLGLLAGCSNDNRKDRGASPESGQPTNQNSANKEAVSDSDPKLNKNAKIRIFGPSNPAVKDIEKGATLNENQFIDAIREQTGYKNLEYVQYDPSSTDKLGLLFATGDQVDMLYGAPQHVYNFMDAQGILQPIDSYLNEAGQDILKAIPETAWTAITKDSKKMAIPVPNYQMHDDQYVGGYGIMVRQDIMEKHGLTQPKTTEDFYQLLKTVQEKEPGMIPIVASAGNNSNPTDGLDFIMAAFGLSLSYEVQDGKIIPTESLYLKDAMEYVSKLYEEGLIDKEYLFNKTEQRNEKITSGKAFAFADGAYSYKTLTDSLKATVPNGKFAFLSPIEGPKGKKGHSMQTPVSLYTVIPKNSKYPLETIDLYNQLLTNKELQTFINYGQEGVHWETTDGKFTPIEPAYGSIVYKIYYRMWYDPEIWWPNVVLGGHEAGIKELTKAGPHNTVFNIANYKPALTVEAEKANALNDLRNEYLAKIINGALPLSAVDEYLTKAEATGRTAVVKEVQAWFDKDGKAIYDSLAQ